MIPIMETVLMLFSFLFSYFLLFVWIPSLFVRFEEESSSMLDKLFISLTHSTLFYMIFVHLLIGIRLLETVSLFVITIVSIVLLSKYYSQSKSISISIKFLTALFDLTEDREQWKIELRALITFLRSNSFSRLLSAKQAIRKHPILIIAYSLVFGFAMIDRFSYSFSNLKFAMSDPYTHLGWSKFMANMTLYMDGVYPYGFEAIIDTIYFIFHIDMYVIMRFIGPLVFVLMMLSLVYALRKMVRMDHTTILLTVFLLAFSSAMMINEPSILMRQLSGLSMEFTAIFLLPGMTFFYLFFKSNKRLYLLFAAECYAISSFGHTFVAVTMTMAFIAIGVAHLDKLIKNKVITRIIIYMGVAGFVGILPPIIGLLAGKSFHGSSVKYMRDEFIPGESLTRMEILISFAKDQPLIVILCSLFFLYLILWFIYRLLYKNKFKSDNENSMIIMAGTFLVMMTIGILSQKLGFPLLVPIDRQPVFLSMALALAFGIGWGFVLRLLKSVNMRSSLQVLFSLFIMFAVLIVPGQKLEYPSLTLQSYDEAIRGYLDIKANYPLKNWDIISPVDELGLILGYGYHTELWEFVRNIEDPDMPNLKFTTPYVFLFVEKVPIDILKGVDFRPITPEEAKMPFPIAPDGLLSEFYYWYDLQNRRILEAKAYYWAEEYMKNNDDMNVFLDTPNFKIYEIYQGKNEVILTKGKQVTSE